MADQTEHTAPETGTDEQSVPVSGLGEELHSTDNNRPKDVLHFSDVSEAAAPATDDEPDSPEGATRPELPDEEILFQRQFCIRAKGSDCSRCEMACPTGAISIDENGWPSIDDQACTRCGICYGVCDAFTSSRVNVIDLRNRVKRVTAGDGPVYVTCRENIFEDTEPAANVLVVPCLAALPPEFVASVLADGTRFILAGNLNYCDDCAIAHDRGALMYDYAFRTAEAWTGSPVEFVDEVPEQKNLVERINQDSRRDAITGLLSVVGDVASGRYRTGLDDEIDTFEATREELHTYAWTAEDFDHPLNRAMRKPGTFKTMFPRRKFLLDAIDADQNIAENVTLTVSNTDPHRCTCAFDCVNACITGARGIDDDDLLTFDARYCIGCGLCVAACKQGACFMHEVQAEDLGRQQRVANDEQVRAILSARALELDANGRKLAADADSIFGAVEPPNPWA